MLSSQLIKNYLHNLVKVKTQNYPVFRPLVFAYFVTTRCNFNCEYCEQAREGSTKQPKDLPWRQTKKLLKIIRYACPNIYFTGGEPLLHPDFHKILKECKRLKFKSISMISNMSLVHKHMYILDYCAALVFSLDMMDEEKYSKVIGASRKTVEQVKNNIIACAKLQKKKKFKMLVNFVANEKTILEAQSVFDFCTKNKIQFTIGPEVNPDGSVRQSIRDNEEYRRFIQHLINLKGKSRVILDSKKYLKTIRDFSKFPCHPSITPRVFSEGQTHYPCGRHPESVEINLIEAGSYQKALKIGKEKFGKLHDCMDKCFMNCYIEPAHIVCHPFASIKEFSRELMNL
jgi:MoaA/NifB/PqqE/SkfB family radical SAM enzyme